MFILPWRSKLSHISVPCPEQLRVNIRTGQEKNEIRFMKDRKLNRLKKVPAVLFQNIPCKSFPVPIKPVPLPLYTSIPKIE